MEEISRDEREMMPEGYAPVLSALAACRQSAPDTAPRLAIQRARARKRTRVALWGNLATCACAVLLLVLSQPDAGLAPQHNDMTAIRSRAVVKASDTDAAPAAVLRTETRAENTGLRVGGLILLGASCAGLTTLTVRHIRQKRQMKRNGEPKKGRK